MLHARGVGDAGQQALIVVTEPAGADVIGSGDGTAERVIPIGDGGSVRKEDERAITLKIVGE